MLHARSKEGLKIPLCVVAFFGVVAAAFGQQLRDANFEIYFEPTAILQTGTEIPFQITVKDALHKPVHGARVTLQVETPEHQNTKVYKAAEIQAGTYIAKPLFPVKGRWNVYVEAYRDDQMTARTIEYYIEK